MTVVRFVVCRVLVLRGEVRDAEASDLSRAKLGNSNFGSLGLGNENELVSLAAGWLLPDTPVPAAAGGRRAGAGDVDVAGFLNGLENVGSLNPSARTVAQKVRESRQVSARAMVQSFTAVLLLARGVVFDDCGLRLILISRC